MAKKAKVVSPVIIDVQKDVPNPQKFPWPYRDSSVTELTCANVFEFVPGKQRGVFMDEIWRILVDGGKANFAVHYWNTQSAVQDYAYEWPPLTEQSFLYFNAGWRKANGLNRPLKCNFDFTYGYSVEPDTANRADDTRSYNIKYLNNVVNVLQVVLTKIKA
jgi:hypothetical protein